MTKRIIVVAPHPDDEIIGVGGTLLKYKAQGHSIAWVIFTGSSADVKDEPSTRNKEIEEIKALVGFDEVYKLGFPAAALDTVPTKQLIESLSRVFLEYQPTDVFLPHPGDVHTDHREVFDASVACTKWFRYPSVKRVMTYETLSETDFCLNKEEAFFPNVYVDIHEWLDKKLELLMVYKSEFSDFPFPRSVYAIKSLAKVRGAASGFGAAEAFQLMRERVE